ncbi:MAG: efflux RND transporter permease subunit, partial [Luteimonas sp.]
MVLSLALAACGGGDEPAQPPPAAVSVVTLAPETVTLTRELPGRTSAFLVAEVRPQVNGIIQERLFTEGSVVEAGEPLYRIDDADYRAATASARAQLARAETALTNARSLERRFEELSGTRYISAQEYENAIAAARQAQAEVGAARAALDATNVTLGRARITAPISGRIGRSSVTAGALVTANQAQALATVQQLDPIHVDLTQSASELLQLRRELEAGTLESGAELPVTILLEDGTPFRHEGRLAFSEVSVDPATGSFGLRVVVDNPDHVLMPGMYVRALVGSGVRQDAILVPQQGVARDPRGNTSVMLVNAEGVVENRAVTVSRTIGDQWLVDEGLAAGDRVIVEGLQKIQPGVPVEVADFDAGQAPAAQDDPATGTEPADAAESAHPDAAEPAADAPGSQLYAETPMARFFFDRPIFAWVIAIVIMLAGGLAITGLPVSMYPTVAPPSVEVRATYPGASAQVVQDSVTQVIEQNMTGLDGLLYFSSQSSSNGAATVSLTFETGTDPDIAQVQVQNQLQLAMPLLPQEVQAQGVNVSKSASGFLQVVAFVSEDGSMDRADIADYVGTNVVDPLSRVPGVGNIQVFGGNYAMRIWLDPNRLDTYALAVPEVVEAIRGQNAQVAVGQLGGTPAIDGQQLNATVNAQDRLQTPEEFRNIVVRSDEDGSVLRLGDIARVELGSESYDFISRYNGQPASGIAISLATGANALDTAAGVNQTLAELEQYFPQGLKSAVPFDTTPFVRISIKNVVMTLIEAIVLVFLVMYLFLQNFRATLIPTIAVPVVLLGTFGVMAVLGFSVNMLTMFGMVLAIGLLVDDAIVVVENV